MRCIFAAIMNKALISIGSNYDREKNIILCRKLLNESFENILYSQTLITIPYGKVYKNDFLNQLAIIETNEGQEEINRKLKNIEKTVGRDHNDKTSGYVKIDVDLVIWNDHVLKEEDMKRSYVAELLDTFE